MNLIWKVLFSLSLCMLIFSVGFYTYTKSKRNSETSLQNDAFIISALESAIIKDSKYAVIGIDKSVFLIRPDNSIMQIDSILLPEGDKVIFTFNETNCTSCIESGFLMLQEMVKTIKKNRIAIIGNSDNTANFFLFLKNFDTMGISSYNLEPSDKKANTKFSNEHFPFFFSLSNDFNVKHFFSPIKEYPKLTNLYLKNLLNDLGK